MSNYMNYYSNIYSVSLKKKNNYQYISNIFKHQLDKTFQITNLIMKKV